MMYTANEIVKGLYQGGAPPTGQGLAETGIDALVLCARDYQPAASFFPGVEVLSVPGDDAPISKVPPAVIAEWQRASLWVAAAVLRGKRVLVTCAAGRNRSGFVSALAVRQLTGLDGARCVEIVQNARPNALTNPTFANFIRTFAACEPMKLVKRLAQKDPADGV